MPEGREAAERESGTESLEDNGDTAVDAAPVPGLPTDNASGMDVIAAAAVVSAVDAAAPDDDDEEVLRCSIFGGALGCLSTDNGGGKCESHI